MSSLTPLAEQLTRLPEIPKGTIPPVASLYTILYIVQYEHSERRRKIRQVNILAVCGMGFGTSLMMLMNVQDLGRRHGIDVRGEAVDLGSAKGRDVDLIVASSEIAQELSTESVPVVGLSNLVDKDELERKVLPALREASGG
jgi:PTS system ascorbate-specific IIB component